MCVSTDTAIPTRWTASEQLGHARQILERESDAILQVAKRLDAHFCRAAELVYFCKGSVVSSGMGKAGIVAQKISATLASTGTPSQWLHPADAVHGDLGRIQRRDVVLILSQSGETQEIVRLLPWIAELGAPLIAVTGRADSTLGRSATATIELGTLEEACPLGLAPSTSTTAMLAVGDALALTVSRMRGFTRDDFARYHPAGNLGYQLSRVDNHMRPREQCRIAFDSRLIRDVFVSVSLPGRRTGAIMLVDSAGRLSGIFTDSDLARLFERHGENDIDRPIGEVMTSAPLRIQAGSLLVDAVAIMAQKKISELPVVDAEGVPVGLLDITDVVGVLPKPSSEGEAERRVDHPAMAASHAGGPRYRLYRGPQ